MIASLSGTVAAVHLDRAVIDVAGVGFLVFATPGTLAGLRVGEPARVATSLVMREDSVTLFAFVDDDERQVFEKVQSVSGIGPRLALAMLAVHSPNALRRALATEDLAALMWVPGIGRKTAQRLQLELADKLGAPSSDTENAAAEGETPEAPPAEQDHRERVVEALVGLGWHPKVAQDTVTKVIAEAGATGIAEADIPGALRAALRLLGGGRG